MHSHSAFAWTCYCPKRGCYCSQADGFVTSSQHALGYAFAPSLWPHRYKTASAKGFTDQNSLLGDFTCLMMADEVFCMPGLAHRSGAWALKGHYHRGLRPASSYGQPSDVAWAPPPFRSSRRTELTALNGADVGVPSCSPRWGGGSEDFSKTWRGHRWGVVAGLYCKALHET